MTLRGFIRRIIRKVKRLRDRNCDSRLVLLKMMPKSAVCAEIGVWKGTFSRQIREFTSPKELHLIDPWEFQGVYPERMYGGKVDKNQADMDQIYQYVKDEFKKYTNVTIHRGFSDKILHDFEDDYFDWLYIDGNHYYEFVLKDLQMTFLKVKKGGLIARDDYTWGEKEGFPVKRAVQDFVSEKKLENNLDILGSQFIINL